MHVTHCDALRRISCLEVKNSIHWGRCASKNWNNGGCHFLHIFSFLTLSPNLTEPFLRWEKQSCSKISPFNQILKKIMLWKQGQPLTNKIVMLDFQLKDFKNVLVQLMFETQRSVCSGQNNFQLVKFDEAFWHLWSCCHCWQSVEPDTGAVLWYHSKAFVRCIQLCWSTATHEPLLLKLSPNCRCQYARLPFNLHGFLHV